jgi:hypothetical protein
MGRIKKEPWEKNIKIHTIKNYGKYVYDERIEN